MKHIKLFEKFNIEDYYQEIGEAEFYRLKGASLFSESNCVFLSKDIRRRLRGLKYITNYYVRILAPNNKVGFKGFAVINPYVNKQTSLSKLTWIYETKDEWYLVRTQQLNDDYRQEHHYYKCDQVDGVVRLLEDIGIVISQ